MRLLALGVVCLGACAPPPTPEASPDAGRVEAPLPDASVDAGSVIDAGIADSGAADSGVADAGPKPCPFPGAGNQNAWAPELSPDGCSLASGLGSVWVNGVKIDPVGWQPVWVSNTRVVYNGIRSDGSEGLKQSVAPFTSVSDVTAPAAFGPFGAASDLDGAEGVFAAYHAAGDFPVQASTGARFAQRMAPAVSSTDGAIAMIGRDDKSIFVADTLVATAANAATDVDVQGDWVVWSAFVPGGRKTHALKRSTGAITDVTASNRANEFFPVLVPVEGAMWLLGFDGGGTLPDRLYLRPLGASTVHLLAQGEVRLPAARWHAASGRIRVAWSNGSGVLSTAEVDPLGQRAPLPP